MPPPRLRLFALSAFFAANLFPSVVTPAFAAFPGELPADDILAGRHPFPPSPAVTVPLRLEGLDRARLGTVPPPGVHPRILISPDQLPDLRARLRDTHTGRALHATLRQRLDRALRDPAYWGGELFRALASGDHATASALVADKKGLPPGIGHYQPFSTILTLEALDSLLAEDADRGRAVATAIATYAELVLPGIELELRQPFSDDVWRSAPPPDAKGWDALGTRTAMGYHQLGYAYDFAHGFMTEPQRASVRRTIATATHGRLWLGARLPAHFRNWNWVAVALGQPLLALAIEGEEGYDPRVVELGVQLARDYLSYGISAQGTSTEAVGYTQFGLVWANPFFVAAQRRGHDLLGHGHHRAMLDWYLHTLLPERDRWLSAGDGGDSGPAIWTLAMWRYFFPADPKAAALWRTVVSASPNNAALNGNFHLVEPLLWASDDPALGQPLPPDGTDLAALALPAITHDTERGTLIARTAWDQNAAYFQLENRIDSVGASHEHADRGHFSFAALGRVWAKDNFRSVETRHHNSILIDGHGQGYWPGPGRWLGVEKHEKLLVAALDVKDAYDWFWPKQILAENPDTFPRFAQKRWSSYGRQARAFQASLGGLVGERDPRPAVVAFWKGFETGDPRLWDEDGWPVRYPHNPVQRAFRTTAFSTAAEPWLLVIDDIQKDDRERLYEWLMQTGPDTELVSAAGTDLILGDAARPKKGDRLLLVRILHQAEPARALDYPSRPSARLESFERRDTLAPGGRSFGLDKRLVIGSRAVAPDFKILLYPHRHGDPLPATTLADGRLTVSTPSLQTTLSLTRDASGRTVVSPVK